MMPKDCGCTKRNNVHCEEKNRCLYCGWNPEVEAMRKKRIALGLPAVPKFERSTQDGQEETD